MVHLIIWFFSIPRRSIFLISSNFTLKAAWCFLNVCPSNCDPRSMATSLLHSTKNRRLRYLWQEPRSERLGTHPSAKNASLSAPQSLNVSLRQSARRYQRIVHPWLQKNHQCRSNWSFSGCNDLDRLVCWAWCFHEAKSGANSTHLR